MDNASLRRRLLEQQHEADMIRMAKTIRDRPAGTERNHSAEIFVRQTLFETPSRITQG